VLSQTPNATVFLNQAHFVLFNHQSKSLCLSAPAIHVTAQELSRQLCDTFMRDQFKCRLASCASVTWSREFPDRPLYRTPRPYYSSLPRNNNTFSRLGKRTNNLCSLHLKMVLMARQAADQFCVTTASV
jgi:hypothetical protein